MQLEAKSEEAERLNNNLRTAEKLYKSKEEELSRQLQEVGQGSGLGAHSFPA